MEDNSVNQSCAPAIDIHSSVEKDDKYEQLYSRMK